MILRYVLIFAILYGNISCNNNIMLNIMNGLMNFKSANFPCQELAVGLNTKELWATKMVDSWSKIPHGIMEGNVLDYGNFDECMAIKNKNITAKYCPLALVVKMKQKQSNYSYVMNLAKRLKLKNLLSTTVKEIPIALSLCVPDTCSLDDFQTFVDGIIPKSDDFNISFMDTLCQTNAAIELDKYDIIAILIFSVIILLVILSTTYDVWIQKHEQKPAHILLIAFSFYSNGKKLIAIQNNPEQLLCLNGLRFISMMWVLVGHRYSSTHQVPAINKLFVYKWKKDVYSQYIQGAPLAVDTFLFISGVVLAYSFLKTQRKLNSKFNLILYYLHRYLRLTPPVAALYLITISLFKFLSTGPTWLFIMKYMKEPCIKYWYSYFLYIQNYVNVNDMCLLHTWYLSIDMQIFLISPLLLLPLLKYRKQAMYAMYVLVVVFIIIPFIITYKYETVMFTVDYNTYYYYVTHTRLAPWIIGLIMGTFILDTKSREFKIHWATNLVIWISILAGMCAIVFTGNGIFNNFHVLNNAVYLSIHRAAWSVGLSWIVFASIKGYGGVIGWFLSLPMFQVLAKLTYSMYLVHILAIMFHLGRIRTPIYISDYDIFYAFCGDLITTLIIATFWTLLFESPVIIIEKVLFRGSSKKNLVEPIKVSTIKLVDTEKDEKLQ